jgi:uncharacterized protein (TIGR02594 family)
MIDALTLASRFKGLAEIPGDDDNPLISGMIAAVRAEMLGGGMAYVSNVPADDETAWCSAFVGFIAILLNVDRPTRHDALRPLALRARAWLPIGHPIVPQHIEAGDVVILNRASGPADATIINAPGHVGFFIKHNDGKLWLRGGNQGNSVSDRGYDPAQLLGVRRWRFNHAPI